MRNSPADPISKLVRGNLVFHNLNRGAEHKLGLSLVQYHLLVTLKDMPGCSPQRLADGAGMHPSSLTPTLRRLLKKKALFVAEDPKDSRKKILSLSRRGHSMILRFKDGIDVLRSSKAI
jgi:DNA-binding MarR family transcriptional regulator